MLQRQFATHIRLENRQRVAWEVNYVIAMIVESGMAPKRTRLIVPIRLGTRRKRDIPFR